MSIEVPEKLRNFNFVLLGKTDKETGEYNCKAPMERGWQKIERRIDNPIFQNHLAENKNYGVRGGTSSPVKVGEEFHDLIILDFDEKETQDLVEKQLPETFTAKTGGKGLYHIYLATDESKSFKVLGKKDEKGKRITLIDVQGEGKQVVGPGSINDKTGKKYEVVKDIPIAFIHYEELLAILKPLDLSEQDKKLKPKKQYVPKNTDGDLAERVLQAISIEEAFTELGIEPSNGRFDCPVHSSTSGKCVKINTDGTAKCFGCGKSWNAYSLLREAKNWTDKETWDFFAERGGLTEELEKSRKEYGKKNQSNNAMKNFEQGLLLAFDKNELAKQIIGKCPMHYNKNKMWIIWNEELKKYENTDETDILNVVKKVAAVNTVNSKERTEILEALKQESRDRKPKEAPLSWVQYKDKIVDFRTGEEFEASPDYYITNPLPHKLGKTEDTPTIDKLFVEWVGEDYKETLEEIASYCVSLEQFMQRIITLVGGGSNGKGTYIKFLIRLLGNENIAASELKELSDNQFETATIYRKLLCVMGEISHDDLRNTNQIKKLAGEDEIRFCFKGKTPFTEKSITTLIAATNSLPRTPDRTTGFYRKFLIVDFPNQFTEIKHGLIENIPEEEFENFCRKTIRILKNLYDTQKFHNEGNFEERMQRYEERSNPVMRFIEKQCEETAEKNTEIRVFANEFNEYAKVNHLRVMSVRQIGKVLKEEGFEQGKRTVQKNDGTLTSKQVILNLAINPINTENTKSSTRNSHGNLVVGNGISGINRTSKHEETDTSDTFTHISEREVQFWDPECKETKDIVVQCTKEEVLEYMKKNPNATAIEAYKKLGIGAMKFYAELKSEGII